MFGKLITYGAAAALAAAPIAAQAAPDRVSTPVAGEEALGGSNLFLPVVIAIGFAIVLYLAIDSEEDLDIPFSP